jgi:hypothetical protein
MKKFKREKRREQSEQDKEIYYTKLGQLNSDPLKVYRELLRKDLSMNTPIPNNLINLSSELIVLLLTRERIRKSKESLVLIDSLWTLFKAIQKTLHLSNVNYSAFLLGMLYIHKYTRKSKSYSEAYQVFLAGIIVADKYLYDATYTNKDWVSFSCHRYSLSKLNTIERLFLIDIDYKIHVSQAEYNEFIEYLDLTLCKIQFLNHSSLGILRYSDFLRLSGSFGKYKLSRLKRFESEYKPFDIITAVVSKTFFIACVYFVIVSLLYILLH